MSPVKYRIHESIPVLTLEHLLLLYKRVFSGFFTLFSVQGNIKMIACQKLPIKYRWSR